MILITGINGEMGSALIKKLSLEPCEIIGLDIKIPVEIQTGKRIRRKVIGNKPVFLRSQTVPIIDPNNWYLWHHDFFPD